MQFVTLNCSYLIDSPKHHHPLGYGWTSFVAQELRADSLIALLTLSELKIAVIQKILPCPALRVRVNNDGKVMCMHACACGLNNYDYYYSGSKKTITERFSWIKFSLNSSFFAACMQ